MTAQLAGPIRLVARQGFWGATWWHQADWWWWMWWLVMAAITVGLVAAMVWLIGRQGGPGPRAATGRARQILAERFARGELTADEYRARQAELEKADDTW